jgi:glycosyltransferase involved in cell wall biosynthesis
MRITFVSGRYPPDFLGGGEISTAILAETLAARGHRVEVISVAARKRREYRKGVLVRRLPLGLQRKPLGEWHASRRDAKLLRPLLISSSIVHAHDFRAVLALAHLPYLPLIATVRDYAALCGGCSNLAWREGGKWGRCADFAGWEKFKRCHRIREAAGMRKLMRIAQYGLNLWWRRRSFLRMPVLIFISQAQRQIFRQYLPLSCSGVIYNAVPPAWFKRLAPPPSRPSVLFVGRMETTKGVGELLDAWRKVREAQPEARLWLVGGGEGERFRQIARRWGLERSVIFYGTVPFAKLRFFYDEAAVVVQPSLWEEPFGRTAAEAAARGRAVVATMSGGLPEIVQHRQTGLLVPRADSAALAEGIIELLRDESLRRKMGFAASQRARKLFHPDSICAQYERWYNHLLRYHHPKPFLETPLREAEKEERAFDARKKERVEKRRA